MVNGGIRQTLELEVVKQAGGSPIRFQKLSDRALWRASPVQRKEETTDSLRASAVAVGAPTTSEGLSPRIGWRRWPTLDAKQPTLKGQPGASEKG
jgi:hypothetical protein